MTAFLILAGVGLLYAGGELLVAASIGLARRFGISPLVVGLTVVAFATSSPELAATLTAALRGAPAIALGNAFGSNIANLGLILSLAVLIHPVRATVRFIRREVAFMVLVTVLVFPMLWGHAVARLEGVILLLLLGVFLQTLLSDPEAAHDPPPVEGGSARPGWQLWLGVAAGIALLVAGAQALVGGATTLAQTLAIPERVIGLTVVAVGTSLPELATSIVAARRREGDIVLGNLIGSNIFNLLCILGVTAIVRPIEVTERAVQLDYWVMLAFSAVVLGVLAWRRGVARWEGVVMLLFYAAYVGFLFR